MKTTAKFTELAGTILSIGSLFAGLMNPMLFLLLPVGLLMFAVGRIARSLAD